MVSVRFPGEGEIRSKSYRSALVRGLISLVEEVQQNESKDL